MVDLLQHLPNFNDQNILVIGDMIADEFITGQPERISREAPVLILEQDEEEILPGGGCNAANNVASLAGNVYLAGVIGDDMVGQKLNTKLNNLGLKTEGLIVDESRPTSVKTRILAGGDQMVKQQVVRVDKLETHAIDKEIEERLIDYVEEIIDQLDAILLSDYGNGVFTTNLKKRVIALANKYNKIITVDSRYNLLTFKGITIATPNKEEAEKAVGFQLDTPDKIEKAGWKLKEKLEADAILITLGGEGMQLFTKEEMIHISASNYTEVFDVTGAGDTVIATLVLSLASGASLEEAMKLANHAAGIVVRKLGVATVTKEELSTVIQGEDNDE
ncbi:ADP-heptose synthase, bifunctional sugar kinase/adenylyltransferase [Halobacteroides halobius DSM 5150]|uniref:ADP-heptose synthase, bifunctional sugar kinase/adenylyltransferase n=1 Tax=Halobacteroides halobius (strain ATCC 35273 / DSM 5150 / MD-1) TaxID=748449 RepID=L0KC87_HALHC|nr:PfkB family carbohydrate kinase [Halobacteroides halobius]AGB42165.1 ADP-heptose synthase, bifunctional sugar kinase/adenylyltransferase [Halobacteroides halobius DSM 5150]